MEDELIDRYGDIPKETQTLLCIALLKAEAHEAYITDITIKDRGMTLKMYPQADINVDAIPGLIEKDNGRLKFMTGANPKFVYQSKKNDPGSTAELIKHARSIIAALRAKA